MAGGIKIKDGGVVGEVWIMNAIQSIIDNAKNNIAAERDEKEVYVMEQIPELTDVELDAVVSQLETYERRRV